MSRNKARSVSYCFFELFGSLRLSLFNGAFDFLYCLLLLVYGVCKRAFSVAQGNTLVFLLQRVIYGFNDL